MSCSSYHESFGIRMELSVTLDFRWCVIRLSSRRFYLQSASCLDCSSRLATVLCHHFWKATTWEPNKKQVDTMVCIMPALNYELWMWNSNMLNSLYRGGDLTILHFSFQCNFRPFLVIDDCRSPCTWISAFDLCQLPCVRQVYSWYAKHVLDVFSVSTKDWWPCAGWPRLCTNQASGLCNAHLSMSTAITRDWWPCCV